MPVYNAEKYLEKAITSILNQTYIDFEFLISDDCSTDNSFAIIKSYNDPRIKIFKNDSNLGYLTTCNLLFLEAKGDYIAFQDADDWSDLKRIEHTIDYLKANLDIDLCGCNFVRVSENESEIISKSNYPIDNIGINKFINKFHNLPFCGASVIFRRNVYEKIGGYRLFYDRIGYEHFDWFLIVSENFKMANISGNLYFYRFVPNSFSRSNKLNNFKKFYAPEIAWFLREQRLKYGFDALQNHKYYDEFSGYLSNLEAIFLNNRNDVYQSVVFQMIFNGNYKQALYTAWVGFKLKEISQSSLLFLLYRILRTRLINTLKKIWK